MLRAIQILLIVAAAAMGTFTGPAGLASAATVPPPGDEMTTADRPAGPPEADPPSIGLRHAVLEGRIVTLKLVCSKSGGVTLSNPQTGKGLGSASYKCKQSRAKVSIKVPSRVAKKAKAHRAFNAMATVVEKGDRTQLPIKIAKGVKDQARDSSQGHHLRASYDRPLDPAWCVPPRFHITVNDSTSFGARLGDTVYWRPAALKLQNGRYTMVYSQVWDSYQVKPEHGQYVWNPDGSMTIAGYNVNRPGNVYVGGSVRAWPAIQSWTPQRGSQLQYIKAAVPYGYGEMYGDYCDFPALR